MIFIKAILLVAGYATRLYPLTENFPKALLSIGGRPLLDYIVDEINEVDDIDEIYAITNDRFYNIFLGWANNKENKKPITVINDGTKSNDDRLGAIGDIKYTIDNMKIKEDIIIIAGDNLFTFKLKDFVSFYKEKKSPCVTVKEIQDNELLKRVGVSQVDNNCKIISFEEKPQEPKSNLATYAEYIYPKETLYLFDEYYKDGNTADAPGNFIKYIIDKIDTYAYIFEGECYDVGTHESLAEVNEIYSKK